MDLQVALNSIATDIFRKQADFDYIAARMNYRMRFRQQFLWSGQQAVEKYLKAILLFNGISARYVDINAKKSKGQFGHNLVKLNAKVSELNYLGYNLPDWAPAFMEYLFKQGGSNRYLSDSSYNTEEALRQLDELVWNIRRYCQYIPDCGIDCDDEVSGSKEAVIRSINNPSYVANPIGFRLSGGELEKIIKRPQSDPARIALVWANLFFGKRNKRKITCRCMSSSEIPPQKRFWFAGVMDDETLADYVKP